MKHFKRDGLDRFNGYLMNHLDSTIDAELANAKQRRDRGDFRGAARICRRLLEERSNAEPVLALFSSILYQAGDFANALPLAKQAVASAPDCAEYYKLIGNIYKRMGDLEAAQNSLERAVALEPSLAEAHYDLGIVHHVQGRPTAASNSYRACVAQNPDYAPAWNNLGLLQLSQRDPQAAMISFERAIAADPSFHGAYINLAGTALDQGQYDEAVRLCRKALSIFVGDYRAYLTMGNALLKQELFHQSIACYRKGLRCYPDHLEILNSMGVAYQKNGEPEAAIGCFEKIVQIKPDAHKTIVHLYNQLRQICDWKRAEPLSTILDDLTACSLNGNDVPVEPPFMSICRDMNEDRHVRIASRWSHEIEKKMTLRQSPPCNVSPGRIRNRLRIGYLTNNYRNHPTTHLLCHIFRLHDRRRFQVFAYSYSARSQNKYARIVQQTSDAFTELYQMNTQDAANTIASDGIDILVDLNGYTDGHRMEICAVRPAPVQVRYLGMAGTTGANFFDYLIGDAVVTPETSARYYTEQLVRMPYTYQANSYRFDAEMMNLNHDKESTKRVADRQFTFCCFCANYKFEKDVFHVWMNILGKVPDSRLWLLRENQSMETNLRREAVAKGISPDRLHFADKKDKIEHLIRLREADLALDTRTVTGAATTSDALWAGVPVLTVKGNHFASRMSASILSAAGMPEMIVENLADYETLAVDLARNPIKLGAVKKKLMLMRESSPLFNTPLFVRHVEAAYRAMWEIYQSGQSPRPINLAPGLD